MRKMFPFLLIFFWACQKPQFLDEETIFLSLDGQSSFQLKTSNYSWLLVNFFAPHCPPCIEELPDLKDFYLNKKAEEGFFAIGSTLEAIESEKENLESIKLEVLKFAKEHKLPYPIYLADYPKLKAWNIKGFPETLIFKKIEGKWFLERKFISAVNKKQLDLYRDGY